MTMAVKHRRKPSSIAFEVIMILLCALMFYPIIMMVLVSLKSDALLAKDPIGVSTSFDLGNYRKAVEGMDFLVALKNSVLLTAFSAVFATLFSACAAYGINRAPRARKFFGMVSLLFFLGLSLPEQVAMVPLVLWMRTLGLSNTIPGLILAFIGGNAAYGLFLFSGFIRTVPESLIEAGTIDGAGPLTVFCRIVLPLLKPPMVTLFIIMSLRVWNNFMYPLLLLQGASSRTLPLAVYLFKGDNTVQWNVMFAATTLTVLPLMLLYFAFQRHIVAGMTTGAVKE